MYLTVEETAEYIKVPVDVVNYLIKEGKIRALYDGEQYVIYRNQFDSHFEQVELVKKQIAEYWAEPIPEDIDVKDED